jgi:chromosomal replication initiation ATPase DnaA
MVSKLFWLQIKRQLICKILNLYYLVSNGIISWIAPTRLQTRISSWKHFARDGVEIPEEIIEYVARNIKSNVRELAKRYYLIDCTLISKKKLLLSWQKCGREIRRTKREISIDYIQKTVLIISN